MDGSTRLWGITTASVGFIPQSLVLRSIVWGRILIYRNWSILSIQHDILWQTQHCVYIFVLCNARLVDSAFRVTCASLNWFFMLFLFLELYEFCLKEGYADKNLIAKWKKQGYENLCCLRCIQCRDTNFGTNCICRVPKAKLEEVSS